MVLFCKRCRIYSATVNVLCVAALFIVSTSAQTQPEAAEKRAVVQRTAPIYPPLARNMALQGNVRMEAVVSPDGSVKTVAVKGGHPVLAQAAVNAVRQWKWQKASRETLEPVEVKFDRE
jgi:TonB family protein